MRNAPSVSTRDALRSRELDQLMGGGGSGPGIRRSRAPGWRTRMRVLTTGPPVTCPTATRVAGAVARHPDIVRQESAL